MKRKPADDLTDDAWYRFLDRSVGGLQEAARRLCAPAATDRHQRRPGWFGKKNKAVDDAMLPDETAVSQALVEAMEEMRDEQFIASPTADATAPDLTGMDFHVEVARRYDPAIGPRAQPTDIQIAIHRDRFDLRIEAKKLTKPGDIKADYLGTKGLGRFDDAKAPYTLERFGGMVAYVTDMDAATWAGLIAADIQATIPRERIKTTRVLGQDLVTTTHVRDVDIPIHEIRGRYTTDVFHIVFEFEAWPSRRTEPADKRRPRRKIAR